MRRLGELDLPDRLAPYAPVWIVQLAFGLMCFAGAVALRAVVDGITPSAGPFAIGFPFVLVATLFGRWQAGAITAVLTLLFSWYFVLPAYGSFAFVNPLDAPRTAINGCAYFVVMGVAELFRQAVRRAAGERDQQIEDRDLMLQEFDHRVKNNFALVASLLDLQRRRAEEPATQAALATALSRIESIARAHRHLYHGAVPTGTVDMASYLHELCGALAEALFLRGAIALECNAAHAQMPRDRAVSIGLVINELVTNASKHAFPGGETGTIHVGFQPNGDGWRLTVADNGRGIPARKPVKTEGGLGQRLIEAFARQANGEVKTESGPGGTVVTVDLAG